MLAKEVLSTCEWKKCSEMVVPLFQLALGRLALVSPSQPHLASRPLPFSFSRSTETLSAALRRTPQITNKESSSGRKILMNLLLLKGLFAEPDTRGSVVTAIKVLTCFDMHEWALCFCFRAPPLKSLFLITRFQHSQIENYTAQRILLAAMIITGGDAGRTKTLSLEKNGQM